MNEKLNLLIRKTRAFFPKSEYFFFQFSRTGRESLPIPLFVRLLPYNKSKKKKRRKTLVEMSAYNELEQSLWRRGKNIILKKLVWNLSLFFFNFYLIFFFFFFFFFFSFTQMKPFTKIFQGFWANIQLKHLLNNYFQERLFW